MYDQLFVVFNAHVMFHLVVCLLNAMENQTVDLSNCGPLVVPLHFSRLSMFHCYILLQLATHCMCGCC